MKLTLVRHGQTHSNVQGIMEGHTPGKLDEQGLQQAKEVAHRLKDEQFAIAYVSDLDRAADTAKPILQLHPKTKVIHTQDLRERNWGELEGVRKEKVKQERGELSFRSFKPAKGESFLEIQERIKRFYDRLLEQHFGESVLVVTHAGLIGALLLHLFGKEVNIEEFIKYKTENAAVTVLEVDKDKKHRVHLFNCTKHLGEKPHIDSVA